MNLLFPTLLLTSPNQSQPPQFRGTYIAISIPSLHSNQSELGDYDSCWDGNSLKIFEESNHKEVTANNVTSTKHRKISG